MATRLGPCGSIAAGDLTLNTSTPPPVLGALFHSPDGRAFRTCRAGGTALVPGKLQQAPVEDTAHQGLTPTAAAIGATQVTVTLGASAVTANEYAGGYLIGTITPGQGQMYLISGHPAADASATVQLTLSDPLIVALTSSSRVDMVLSPYSYLVVNPTTQTSAPVGAAVFAITAEYYGYVQVGGPAALLADGALTVGLDVVASNATAGAVEVIADGASELLPRVGCALTGVATTDYGAVLLGLK